MATPTINTDTSQKSAAPTFAFADFVVLGGAIVIVIAFLLLPWISGTINGKEIEPNSSAIQLLASTGHWVSALSLILVAGVISGVLAVQSLRDVSYSRSFSYLVVVLAVIGLIYFLAFFAQEATSGLEARIGFWAALVALAALVVQVFIPRPASNRQSDFIARLGILGELMMFLWQRKLYWLLPMMITLIIFALLIISASQSGVIAPFIYTLF